MMFVARNRELFVINANVHNFPTRSHNDLHLPIANLSVFQKGVYFSGVKIFNDLPTDLKHFTMFISLKKPQKGFFWTTPFTHYRSIIIGKKMSLVNNNNQYYLINFFNITILYLT